MPCATEWPSPERLYGVNSTNIRIATGLIAEVTDMAKFEGFLRSDDGKSAMREDGSWDRGSCGT